MDFAFRIGRIVSATTCALALVGALAASPVLAAGNDKTQAEKPRYGGTLVYTVRSAPPSWDAHQETTIDVIHPGAPFYSLLLKFDPEHYPKVVGDLAESWTVSKDNKTYTFKLHKDVQFHDGALLTAKDVKASYEHIIFPPAGVISPRQPLYSAVEKIEAPDDSTVVFTLKYPSASFLASMAAPYNWIYKAENLQKDPQWYKDAAHIDGTGPFKLVEMVAGSHVQGKRNDAYFVKGHPYLDGFRAIYIKSDATRVAAIRGGRAAVDFRFISVSQRDELVKAVGNDIRVQETPMSANNGFAINSRKKPFDDVRVRRALRLALDQWKGSQVLYKISTDRWVGALVRPGSEFAMSDAELSQVEGFSRNIDASRAEARRLLREAGVPDGFKFTLSNRYAYEPEGIWLVDQWRAIGLNVTQVFLDDGPLYDLIRKGDFDVAAAPGSDFMDDPSVELAKYVSADKTGSNYGGYTDRVLDDLFDKQDRELNPVARKKLVNQFEKRVLAEQAYYIAIPWIHRIVAHSSKMKGWTLLPSHTLNQDLANVWLSDG